MVDSSKFRRPAPGEVPTSGADDELLADPPKQDLSAFAADAKGRPARIAVLVGVVVFVLGGTIGGVLWVRAEVERRRNPVPVYQVDPATIEGRSRDFEWSNGAARLGLSREPPGIERIVLPDRVLVLAEGQEHAQVIVEVQDGKTTRVKVLVGEVEQQPRPAAEESPPAPPATPP